MIILGDRYIFSEVEKARLKKQFNKMNHISYSNVSTKQCVKHINKLLSVNDTSIILLNTKEILPSKLLTYLTRLELKGIKYITIEHFLEKYLHKCLIEESSKDITFLEQIHEYTPFQYLQKRVVDYISVIALFLPTLLFTIYTKYRIEKESPGPLFFKQLRVGKKEEEFYCIKLRSMCIDAEKNGAEFACDNDPRTYQWGSKIRYTKIDELLQLWNVIKGEMHFVGPRPERKIWTTEFEKSIPFYTQRHVVAPGITGLAQIKYQYGAGKLDAEQKLMYDLYYIKHWNLLLELEIIWKTTLFVFTKKRENLSNF